MGSRLRVVAESFSNFPSAQNTWEISHTAQRGTKAECDGQPMRQSGLQAGTPLLA
jgi:hypothetical protein